MPKIDPNTVPVRSGSRYPAPHDEPVKGRLWQALGVAAGLTQFGVNLVKLRPGVWSSQRHWHMLEDEFVYILEGTATLVTDAGRELLRVGEGAGFPAGEKNGHHLINETEEDVIFLAIGTRDDADYGEYSDIDMKFGPTRYSEPLSYTRKDGSPI